MKKRITWFTIITILMFGAYWITNKTVDVPVANAVALAQVNGGDEEFAAVNALESIRNNALPLAVIVWFWASIVILVPRGLFSKANKENAAATAKVASIVMLALYASGCRMPFDTPEYIEIEPHQTAYVIPIDTQSKNQVKFASEEYLDELKVAAKRVQIPHRWVKTGRWSGAYQGKYIGTVRVVVVDRTPLTREWDSDAKTGKAIWTESADSVGFSMGWNLTAYVQEKDTSKFLYWYPSQSLAVVMDNEIRGRIQQSSATECAKFKLDDLRNKKNEIADAVRTDIIPFFASRGITITSIGQFGGMSYENPRIQEAIDQTFITQQEKVNAASMLEAQADKNARILSEANALADAAARKGKGEADAITFVNEALAKAANNPQLIQLRALEVESLRVAKWGGTYPTMVSGEGANLWVGLGAGPESTAGSAK